MKLKPGKPSRRRAQVFSTVGSVIGGVFGALPVRVSPKAPARPGLVKLLVPAGAAAIVAVVVVRRHRKQDPAPESWASPEPADLATAGAAPSAPTPSPAAPAATQTEKDKAEAVGDTTPTESVQETAIAGGAETPASADAGATRPDDA